MHLPSRLLSSFPFFIDFLVLRIATLPFVWLESEVFGLTLFTAMNSENILSFVKVEALEKGTALVDLAGCSVSDNSGLKNVAKAFEVVEDVSVLPSLRHLSNEQFDLDVGALHDAGLLEYGLFEEGFFA